MQTGGISSAVSPRGRCWIFSSDGKEQDFPSHAWNGSDCFFSVLLLFFLVIFYPPLPTHPATPANSTYSPFPHAELFAPTLQPLPPVTHAFSIGHTSSSSQFSKFSSLQLWKPSLLQFVTELHVLCHNFHSVQFCVYYRCCILISNLYSPSPISGQWFKHCMRELKKKENDWKVHTQRFLMARCNSWKPT